MLEKPKRSISLEISHIRDLRFDPKNARQHNERNIGMIADGLQEVGAGRSILIDGTGEIIAGNGVAEAAAQAGITKVRVIETAGDELIAVMRKDLTGRKKQRAALLDNRTQDISGWNTDVLRGMVQDDEEALRGLWSSEEINALMALPTLPLDDNDVRGESQAATTDDGMQRMTLWVPREDYDFFMNQIRALSATTGEDDVSRVVMQAVNLANEQLTGKKG